jgi:hypothetical protein
MPNTSEKLHAANKAKNDEFYTQLSDIENELWHYRDFFRGKTILCNCDDPEWSNFWKYFAMNFDFFGIKKLIATHYEKGKQSYKLELCNDENKDGKIDGKDLIKTDLSGDGDFRSPECVEILKEADIVITNPPFSLFREYVAQLMRYGKKFIVIGNQNAITYKEIFPLIKNNDMWLGFGFSGNAAYFVSDKYTDYAHASQHKKGMIRVSGVVWFTNIDIKKRHEKIVLTSVYKGNESHYPFYDNYKAINVNKTLDIPEDYLGEIGVPITFLDKYNPDQFEIVRFRKGNDGKDLSINGKCPYFRIIIRRKQ